MPCTANKFEAGRPEMLHDGIPDIDAVLTTRELAQVIKTFGLDLASMSGEPADTPFGDRSSAGKLFGASGGVMEAAVRTAHYLITGKELDLPRINAIRGLDGIKEASVNVAGTEVKVAVVSGLGNARKLLDQIVAGRNDLHFIEIMTCPGGCISGGGQPVHTDPEVLKARMQALYNIDKDATMRTSHSNPSIQRIYKEFLGEPGGHLSHELLHTHYAERDVLR